MARKSALHALPLALCFLLVVSFLWPSADAVTVYGKGGTSANKFYKSLSYLYPFYRDSVAIDWEGVAVLESISQYDQGLIDFIMVDSKFTTNMTEKGFYGLPMVGSALVMVYNLPSFNDTLVLDGETLALIWCGEISHWNDSRLAALNEGADLPYAAIELTYYPGQTPGTVLLLKDALSNYSAVFAQELEAAGGLFEHMKPNTTGHAYPTYNNSERLDYVRNTPYSLTYYWLEDVLDNPDLDYAVMKNRAGNIVQPGTLSVQSAMNDFNDLVEAGQLDTPLYNGPGNDSWPIPFITFLALKQNITAADCTSIKELLNFIAWTQINDQAISAVSGMGYMPLAFAYRSKLIDMLGRITCNGDQALPTAYLLGLGAGLPVYTDWSLTFSNTQTNLKIYTDLTRKAPLEQIISGVVDFEMSTEKPTNSQMAASDLLSIPLVATAIVPAYYIPSLHTNQTLVFTFELLADILLNKVTTWDDASISTLNPGILLPSQDIIIAFDNRSSFNSPWIKALRRVDEFNAKVSKDDVTALPVFIKAPERIREAGPTTLGSTMKKNNHSMSISDLHAFRLVRGLSVGQLRDGIELLTADQASVIAALNADSSVMSSQQTTRSLNTGGAWPMVRVHRLFMRASMSNCFKAQAVADWVYWTQKSSLADAGAVRSWAVIANHAKSGDKLLTSFLSSVTCEGVAVSSVYDCIFNGTFCNNNGECTNGQCRCNDGWKGTHCEQLTSLSADSTDVVLGAVLGSVIPVVLILAVLLICLALVAFRISRKKQHNEWEMDFEELELAEQLGAGGYGVVVKAKWRGTEVAVKTIAAKNITKDMERGFREEVRVMTALRHPNVVLFMGASTSLPNLCIVMEYMTLGSLFDLLHNDLIPVLPFVLKAKMAYQTARGMHFLHSSGVVHRDLKSMNLLLDAKWNVKVSDFGLTKFRAEMKKRSGAQAGSVHWSAPEVLNESTDVDYVLADVYSFGIILWEILTRHIPYYGLSPAAIAVAVIRDNLRPPLPSDSVQQDFLALVQSCWHCDPAVRPTFLEIMTRLGTMAGESSGSGISSSSSEGVGAPHPRDASWTLPSGTSSSSGSQSSHRFSAEIDPAAEVTGGVSPPSGEVAVVFSDVTRAASLWEAHPEAMCAATMLHNGLLRDLLARHGGYEVTSSDSRPVITSGEGSFCMAFQHSLDALEWCTDVQQELLRVNWPEELLEHPGAAEEWGDTDDRLIFRGLRVRMGVHFGEPYRARDPMTRRTEYYGPVVNAAARITALTHGGQVVLSQSVLDSLKDAVTEQEYNMMRFIGLGKFEMPDAPLGTNVYELKVRDLEARFFGGVTSGNVRESQAEDGDDAEQSKHAVDAVALNTVVGEGLMFKEDGFLTSANLCRWVIDFDTVQLGKQIGIGSYGVVYKGRWKGIEVAVKRFINQKLDERRMLEFRSEMAFLSELHHPNIVLFIGACVKRPNMCILTEFVATGSLAEILPETSIKLAWKQRLKLLRSAALGINYLHSLQPCIVHRDLKPSNLLVDENWNVKVADFGLARIKQDNVTMTRCGTPCWTAPEIIRGERYSEKVDIYSFGIVMWEVVTRKQPFAGRNFMSVSLDVLEGRRPVIPSDCPREVKKMIRKCWHDEAARRPTMDAIIDLLDDLIGEQEEEKASPDDVEPDLEHNL